MECGLWRRGRRGGSIGGGAVDGWKTENGEGRGGEGRGGEKRREKLRVGCGFEKELKWKEKNQRKL